MPHPFSVKGQSGCDCGAVGKLAEGDRFIYAINLRTGVADEFLHDGDAFVTWDDGTYGTIKWNWMYPETEIGRLAARRHRVAWGLE